MLIHFGILGCQKPIWQKLQRFFIWILLEEKLWDFGVSQTFLKKCKGFHLPGYSLPISIWLFSCMTFTTCERLVFSSLALFHWHIAAVSWESLVRTSRNRAFWASSSNSINSLAETTLMPLWPLGSTRSTQMPRCCNFHNGSLATTAASISAL